LQRWWPGDHLLSAALLGLEWICASMGELSQGMSQQDLAIYIDIDTYQI
jgi:hypothetical protein